MEYLIYIVIGVCFIWLCLNLYIYFFGHRWLYYPYPHEDLPKNFGIDMEYAYISGFRGANLLMWYKKPKPNMPTIIYFHGRAESLGWRTNRFNHYVEAGYGLICPEYRYNGNHYKFATERLVMKDCKKIIDWVKNKLEIPVEDTFLYGESMGSAIATKICAKHRSYKYKGLILEVPFDSMYRVYQRGAWYCPIIPMFMRDKYHTYKHIKKVKCPILIGGAELDRTCPIKQSLLLYKNAKAPVKHITFNNREHMDLYNDFNWINEVFKFCKKGLPKDKKTKQVFK